jgi:hypothetical protein
MLHAALAFLPVALTFPENPNSIDSPLAWHPLSTGIGKLPPGSLRAWWDASKLNANDVYWGDPYIPDSSFSCGGQIQYLGSGVAGGNILTVDSQTYSPLLNNLFLTGVARPGILFQFEGDLNRTVYEIVSGVDANGLVIATNFTTDTNRFVVKPEFSSTYSGRKILVAQLQRWPDESGNREHMGYWPLAGIRSPGIFVLDSNSGQLFHDGYIAHYGSGNQMLSGITAGEFLSLGHSSSVRGAVIVHELIIGKGPLDSNTRLELEGYLAWKWGVSEKLAMSHPYAQAPVQSSWNPLELGNDLWIWLDANSRDSVFSDVGCATLAADNGIVSCWKDLSHYQRHLYQGNDFSIVLGQWQNKPGVVLNYDSVKGPTSLTTAAAATWLNNQNYFVAMVTRKLEKEYTKNYAWGPLYIGNKTFFPFHGNVCIGVSGAFNNPTIQTQYTAQKTTLVLQGNVRNKPFYKPYFNSAIKSSLTTRSAPMYLHEQPYLLAMVADFLETPNIASGYSPILFGTLIPAGNYDINSYFNHYLGFGASSLIEGKLMLDQGWHGLPYDINLDTQLNVYLVWRKESDKTPLVTVNGLPISPFIAGGTNGFLKVSSHQLSMLAMGDYQIGNRPNRFSGSIYEAMVLTGPNIKYGHQRLIEGYLAWKWGLQHKLPRRHSYRHVPPAR